MTSQLQLNFDVQRDPPPLLPDDPNVANLRSLLACAVGLDRAITINQIANMLNLSRRATEALLESAIADLDFPLVAGSYGYFIPENKDDITRYLISLHSRIKCLAIRMRSVRRNARAAGLLD